MTTWKQRILASGAVLLAVALAGCGGSGADPGGADSGSASPTAAAQFPIIQKNAWGETKVEAAPTRVAVVSGGDRDIAYALGIKPVISPTCPGCFVSPYVAETEKKLGISNPTTFDDTDGTDFEAVAAAEPDIILGVNSYSMDEEYEKLAKIAPVVTFSDPDQVSDMTWEDRLLRAAEALGMTDQANQVIAANKKIAADAAAAHPEFAGKTYTYVVVHPNQLSYISSSDQDPGVFEALGLVKAPNSKNYSTEKDGVSLENVDQFDADVVLIAYPFGDEGIISRSKLESNKLWQSIPAVKNGHSAVVDAESGLASDIAYPTVLAYPWVVEQITPILDKAING
ncbi:MAG: ABC transporter substrate-binding protein [Microlunatus sp.]